MNILAEMKSFSLWIGDSICSLNKTRTCILILITSTKRYENVLEHKTAFPDEIFPSIFPVKAIQVRKFVSRFVRTFGCVSWLSSQAFDEKRENWSQVLSLRSMRKAKFSDFFSRSWLPCRFTRIFGSHPSVTNSPVKGSSIIALTNLPSKLSTTEKQWAIYHASSRR